MRGPARRTDARAHQSRYRRTRIRSTHTQTRVIPGNLQRDVAYHQSGFHRSSERRLCLMSTCASSGHLDWRCYAAWRRSLSCRPILQAKWRTTRAWRCVMSGSMETDRTMTASPIRGMGTRLRMAALESKPNARARTSAPGGEGPEDGSSGLMVGRFPPTILKSPRASPGPRAAPSCSRWTSGTPRCLRPARAPRSVAEDAFLRERPGGRE